MWDFLTQADVNVPRVTEEIGDMHMFAKHLDSTSFFLEQYNIHEEF